MMTFTITINTSLSLFIILTFPHTYAMASQPRLKMALIGLGRLGAIRARILAFQQPRIELVAACDTKTGSDKWAAENLPPTVKYFADPEDCMRNSGAQAVLISTATATHAPLILLGLDLGLVGIPSDSLTSLALTFV